MSDQSETTDEQKRFGLVVEGDDGWYFVLADRRPVGPYPTEQEAMSAGVKE